MHSRRKAVTVVTSCPTGQAMVIFYKGKFDLTEIIHVIAVSTTDRIKQTSLLDENLWTVQHRSHSNTKTKLSVTSHAVPQLSHP